MYGLKFMVYIFFFRKKYNYLYDFLFLFYEIFLDFFIYVYEYYNIVYVIKILKLKCMGYIVCFYKV